jgi:Uma2 family endonuclease
MTPTTITPPPTAAPATPTANGSVPPSPAGGWVPFRWTIPEYRRLGSLGLFDDVKVMLIDGEIFTMVMPNPPHDAALNLTFQYLLAACPAGHHVRNQQGLDIGTRTDPGPDLAIVAGSIRDYATRTPTAALMVVEVADTTLSKDTTAKAEWYATAGVPEYWVVDVENRRLLVYRDPESLPKGLGATAYRTHAAHGPDETVAPLAAPNAKVKIADLLP